MPPHSTAHRLLAGFAFLWAAPAFADVPCDTVTFPDTPAHVIHMARVIPGTKAVFLTGRGNCPSDTPACRQTAYLVPGDLVLTGATYHAYTCAYYVGRNSETAGWLAMAQLKQQPSTVSGPGAWLGTWHNGDNTLAITQAGSDLAVSARAYWPSRSDPNGHEGQLDAKARMSANTLSLADPDDPQGCKLSLALAGTYIIARDNGACGGANVTFSGVYKK